MATNQVEIVGEDSALNIYATNLTGADPVEFDNGSFVGSPEEVRKVVLWVTIGAKVLQLKLEWKDPAFNLTTITGAPVKRGNV